MTGDLIILFINYSPRTTAWMQEVEQRREQLPRHEEHEEKKQENKVTKKKWQK
jgi:hypothetical protein